MALHPALAHASLAYMTPTCNSRHPRIATMLSSRAKWTCVPRLQLLLSWSSGTRSYCQVVISGIVCPKVGMGMSLDGVAIETRPGRGRCLVATRAFSAGDLVIQGEPYCWVLNSGPPSDQHCHYCLTVSSNLQRCGRCRVPRCMPDMFSVLFCPLQHFPCHPSRPFYPLLQVLWQGPPEGSLGGRAQGGVCSTCSSQLKSSDPHCAPAGTHSMEGTQVCQG
jgi:hypothetical protein